MTVLKSHKSIILEQLRNFYSISNSLPNVKDYKTIGVRHDLTIGKRSRKVNADNYIHNYFDMVSNNEYYVLLSDESIITIFYRFNEQGDVISHSLSYIPSVPLEITESDSKEYSLDEKFLNLKHSSNYIRIDYDPELFEEIVHSEVHLHFGLFCKDRDSDIKCFRFAFHGIVYPYDFIYIVLKYCYQIDAEILNELVKWNLTRLSKLHSIEKEMLYLTFRNNQYQTI